MGCGSNRSAAATQPQVATANASGKAEVAVDVADQKTLTLKLTNMNGKLVSEQAREKTACKKFNEIDKDKSGYISFEEMFKYIKDKAMEKKKPFPSQMKLQELINRYDKDKNGMLSREEFGPFLKDSLKVTREQYVEAYAKKEAAKYRKKKNITPNPQAKAKELGALLRDTSMYVSVLKEEMKIADKDRSGTLDIEEFYVFTRDLCKKYECIELDNVEINQIIEDIGLKGILGLCVEDVLYASHATLLISQLITAGEA